MVMVSKPLDNNQNFESLWMWKSLFKIKTENIHHTLNIHSRNCEFFFQLIISLRTHHKGKTLSTLVPLVQRVIKSIIDVASNCFHLLANIVHLMSFFSDNCSTLVTSINGPFMYICFLCSGVL